MRESMIRVLGKIIRFHQEFYVYVSLKLDRLHTRLISRSVLPKIKTKYSKVAKTIANSEGFDIAVNTMESIFTNDLGLVADESNLKVVKGTCRTPGAFRRSDCPK